MNTKKIIFAGALMPFLCGGCLVVPEHRGGNVVLVPPLPAIVVLDTEPYYVNGGYHYHYRNDGWYYSRARSGPWAPLPKDRYPKEVKYKHGGDGRDGGRNPGHQER